MWKSEVFQAMFIPIYRTPIDVSIRIAKVINWFQRLIAASRCPKKTLFRTCHNYRENIKGYIEYLLQKLFIICYISFAPYHIPILWLFVTYTLFGTSWTPFGTHWIFLEHAKIGRITLKTVRKNMKFDLYIITVCRLSKWWCF